MKELRRLATIVSADVAGYSRLMGRDENGILARLKAHQAQPTCFRASPSFQILVMWLILSPLNCIT